MIPRPPRSTQSRSSAASDVYKRQHLHPSLVTYIASTYPERVIFVTDAMAAAGAADGDYILGTLAVEVRGGVARIAGTDTIAGSTLTLSKALSNAVAYGVA